MDALAPSRARRVVLTGFTGLSRATAQRRGHFGAGSFEATCRGAHTAAVHFDRKATAQLADNAIGKLDRVNKPKK